MENNQKQSLYYQLLSYSVSHHIQEEYDEKK